MHRLLLTTALAIAVPNVAAAQAAPSTPVTGGEPHAIVVLPTEINWKPGPPSVPPGAKAAVIEGDPAKPGPFTMRLWLPDGYRIGPHTHPAVEHVTVMKGTFAIGTGEQFDTSKLKELPAGAFSALPAGMPHFVRIKGETILQLHGIGPWGLTYVNPADDPRKKGT